MATRLRAYILKPQHTIGAEEYKTAWCESIDGKDTLGYCDDVARVIYVKTGLKPEESFRVILHEVLHGIDDVYDVKLSHKQIYKLETALADYLLKNDLIKAGK